MVYVEKGGEIIPKITGVELAERTAECVPFEYIDRCPECGAELVRFEGEAKHYCPNQSGCRPQIVGRIVHFIGRKALNIDGLGGETVELLFENGLVRDIADLYSLKAADLAVLPRLGEKSADNIINSIEASKSVPFARVLFGLGIRFVGETTAKYMAAHFKSLEAVAAASKEELMESDEVGDKIADSIIGYFADPVNISILERLRCAGLQFEAEVAERQSDTLAGKNVVVSGKFTLHSRDELKALIELHGGKNQSGVSSNTDFIVAGENMGPAKLQKAEKLGVKILSEQEFIALIGSDEIPKAEEKVVEAQPIQASLF
jgi:DNA ligase (NAD+)